jgi:hypothetical protein
MTVALCSMKSFGLPYMVPPEEANTTLAIFLATLFQKEEGFHHVGLDIKCRVIIRSLR